MFFGQMHPSWRRALAASEDILNAIEQALAGQSELTPPIDQVMRAFENPLESTKVLLLGQDPYPTEGVACGLAFAVSPGMKQPQSLKNLMKELASDLPEVSSSGEIQRWSQQGVMLLNSALSTRVGSPAAHSKLWSQFTSFAIRTLDTELEGNLVCLSLGEHAKKLAKNVSLGEVVQAVHPSPLSASRGFFGSKIYSRTNSALSARSITPIDWSC